MAINLNTSYPGKVTVDANNPNGTFKNRTSDALKDGTPYEKKWSSDVWGFLAHILGLASVAPSGAEENETNSQYYDALEGLVGRRQVDFETKDLIINVQSNTTVDMDAARMSLLDSSFIPIFLDDIDKTFTMPTDIEAGTSEKASHWYGMWMDSDEVLKLVPDLTGSADSIGASQLKDSTATFLTDLVHLGDIVYNTDDLTKATATADASAEGIVSLSADIFPAGNESYKIVKMSPLGLGENRERFGAAYNDSSSHFDNSIYEQIQAKKKYSAPEAFIPTSTTPGFSLTFCDVIVKQVNDEWYAEIAYEATFTAGSSLNLTIPGMSYASSIINPMVNGQLTGIASGRTVVDSATGIITAAWVSALTIRGAVQGTVKLLTKPTFHN